MVHAVRRMCVVCRMLRVNVWYGARRRIPAFDCLPYASGFRQLIFEFGLHGFQPRLLLGRSAKPPKRWYRACACVRVNMSVCVFEHMCLHSILCVRVLCHPSWPPTRPCLCLWLCLTFFSWYRGYGQNLLKPSSILPSCPHLMLSPSLVSVGLCRVVYMCASTRTPPPPCECAHVQSRTLRRLGYPSIHPSIHPAGTKLGCWTHCR
jgi:hypothetical protein